MILYRVLLLPFLLLIITFLCPYFQKRFKRCLKTVEKKVK